MMTLMATALVAPVAGAGTAPRILATTGLIAEAARRLTGHDIRAIAAPPHDPALHRPGRSDLVAIADADLVLRHGLGLEQRMEPVLARQAQAGRVIAMAELLPADQVAGGVQIAQDPALWSAAVLALAGRLAQELPVQAEAIQREGRAFADEIAAHAPALAAWLAPVPAPRRILVSETGSMAHFGRAFGFDTIALDTHADARSLAALAGHLAATGTAALFCGADCGAARQLQQIAAAQGHALHLAGAPLTDADWPAPPGSSGWQAMMTQNARHIATALAPAPAALA